MTILTNFLIFIFSIYFFKQLTKFNHPYSNSWAWFVFLVGISSCFGSVAHAVHYQSGRTFFEVIFYIMNALNLISIYFCFRAPYIYNTKDKTSPSKKIVYLVIVWISALLIYTLFQNQFLIIKIHAGIVLLYSLIIHIMFYKRYNESGSGFVVLGISISFVSIVVHSFKLSIDEWFNYKDFAHVIILFSLMFIFKGVKLNAEKLILEK